MPKKAVHAEKASIGFLFAIETPRMNIAHLGVREIGRYLHLRDGDALDSGITHFERNHLSQFSLDLLRNLKRAL